MAGSTARDALAQQLLRLPRPRYAPWLDRRSALAVVENDGLPNRRSESWRHTNIERWYEAVAASDVVTAGSHRQASAGIAVNAPAGVSVASFSDSNVDRQLAEQPSLATDPSSLPLAAVNALLLGAGVVVFARHDVAEPVRIGGADTAGTAEFQHLLVIVESGASLTLVEEPATFVQRLVEVRVGSGGNLAHWRRQGSAGNRECSLVAVHVETGGTYRLAQSSRGADLRRNDIDITLAGAGAEASVHGVWRLDERGHLDNQIAINHREDHGRSRQIYRGVAAGHGRAILNGRIHVAQGTVGTDATLSSKNLLASATAQVFAKPELEIQASDVSCSHGATIGALDAASIHYLRSRGIDEDTARALLTDGFLRDAIADVEGAKQLALTRR